MKGSGERIFKRGVAWREKWSGGVGECWRRPAARATPCRIFSSHHRSFSGTLHPVMAALETATFIIKLISPLLVLGAKHGLAAFSSGHTASPDADPAGGHSNAVAHATGGMLHSVGEVMTHFATGIAHETFGKWLEDREDITTRTENEQLSRFVGAVLAGLVARSAKEGQFERDRADLEALAKTLPEAWPRFVSAHAEGEAPLDGQKFITAITQQLQSENPQGCASAQVFESFFIWMANPREMESAWPGQKKVPAAIFRLHGRKIFSLLAADMPQRLGEVLPAALTSADPLCARAWRKTVLRFHARLSTDLATLLDRSQANSAALERVERLLREWSAFFETHSTELQDILGDLQGSFRQIETLIAGFAEKLASQEAVLAGIEATGADAHAHLLAQEKMISELPEKISQLLPTTPEERLERMERKLESLPDAPPWDLSGYARALQDHCLLIPLATTSGSEGIEHLTLRTVFVPPSLRLFPLRDPRDIELPAEAREAAMRGEIEHLPRDVQPNARRFAELHREQPRVLALTAIMAPTDRGHVVLGEAGLGKTSLVRHLALEWADAAAARPGGDPALPVPLYIELKSYAAATGEQLIHSLLGYLQNSLDSIFHLPEQECMRRLTDGRAFLILDALDEVTHPRIVASIRRQACRLLEKGARILLTSRTSGFERSEWPHDAAWKRWLLQEFEEPERQQFLAKVAPLIWIAEAERTRRVAELETRFTRHPELARLARNPLLLTLILRLHRGGRLGDSRTAIYKEASEWLLDRWEKLHHPEDEKAHVDDYLPFTRLSRRLIARKLARRIYEQNLSARLGENLFPLSFLQDVIRDVMDPRGIDPEKAELYAERLPDLLRKRHSLLCWAGGENFAFIHRTFLEFFLAEAWREDADLKKLNSQEFKTCLLQASDPGRPPRWRDERYASAIPFHFGLLDFTRLRDRLPVLPHLGDSEHSGEAILFAASCYEEVQEKDLFTNFCFEEAQQEKTQARGKDPALGFASDLQHRLTGLAQSPWAEKGGAFEEAERKRECCRRAVRLLARVFGDTQHGHAWLWVNVESPRLHDAVRAEIIAQLGLLLGKNENLRVLLVQMITPAGEQGRMDSIMTYRTPGAPGQQDAGTRRESQIIIGQAIRTLGQVWGREPFLRPLLERIVGDPNEESWNRCHAIGTLAQVFGRDEELRALLARIAGSRRQSYWVRNYIVETSLNVWGLQEWLRELLEKIAGHDEEDIFMQEQALKILVHRSGRAE
jgi:hypothetical protein